MPSIQTVAQTLRLVRAAGAIPDRRRWPCGRRTRACLAAVTTWPPSAVKKLEQLGAVVLDLGPVRSRPAGPSSSSVKRAAVRAGRRCRRGTGDRRRGWARHRSRLGRIGSAGTSRPGSARAAVGVLGVVGRGGGRVVGPVRRPKKPVVQVSPGSSDDRFGLQRRRRCARPAAGSPGSSAPRPGHGAPSARPRPVSWSASVAHRSARPRQPTSSHGVGRACSAGPPSADPVAGHLDRGEVEVLADVVLVGAHRARRARARRPGRAPGRRSTGVGAGLVTLDVPEPGGRAARPTAAPPTTVRSPQPAEPVGRWSGRSHRLGRGAHLSDQRDRIDHPSASRRRSQSPPGRRPRRSPGRAGPTRPATSSRSSAPLSVTRTATSHGF